MPEPQQMDPQPLLSRDPPTTQLENPEWVVEKVGFSGCLFPAGLGPVAELPQTLSHAAGDGAPERFGICKGRRV